MSIMQTLENLENHERWLAVARKVRDRLSEAEHHTAHAIAGGLRALADELDAEPDVEKPS